MFYVSSRIFLLPTRKYLIGHLVSGLGSKCTRPSDRAEALQQALASNEWNKRMWINLNLTQCTFTTELLTSTDSMTFDDENDLWIFFLLYYAYTIRRGIWYIGRPIFTGVCVRLEWSHALGKRSFLHLPLNVHVFLKIVIWSCDCYFPYNALVLWKQILHKARHI